ncbi:MAG TPA: hypothetical protein VHH72_06980 [Solirubrobacterales bacterium]|jgi:hypothetical protein|nr:hypothetical protein [Solirubrobacterales bacterium]
MAESCTWCGVEVEADDGFRAYEPAGERRAVFCRLEHTIPWALQAAHWEAGTLTEPANLDEEVSRCSHCDAELGDVHVLLVRHRGDYRVADGFCSVDHMVEWAKAGGRWR